MIEWGVGGVEPAADLEKEASRDLRESREGGESFEGFFCSALAAFKVSLTPEFTFWERTSTTTVGYGD